jgi:hypothetical protein
MQLTRYILDPRVKLPISIFPPCSLPGAVLAPSLYILSLNSASSSCPTYPPETFGSDIPFAPSAATFASRSFHWSSSSRDGAVAMIPGCGRPWNETWGMCRDDVSSPWKSQIDLNGLVMWSGWSRDPRSGRVIEYPHGWDSNGTMLRYQSC